jgi:hypothetical protein
MTKRQNKAELRTISPKVVQSVLFLLEFLDSIVDERCARKATINDELTNILNLHLLNELCFHIESVRDWAGEKFLKCRQNDRVKKILTKKEQGGRRLSDVLGMVQK